MASASAQEEARKGKVGLLCVVHLNQVQIAKSRRAIGMLIMMLVNLKFKASRRKMQDLLSFLCIGSQRSETQRANFGGI